MKKGLIVLAALAAFSAANATILIDDFSDGLYGVSLQSGSDLNFESASVLGGDRATYIEVEANPLNQFVDLLVGAGGFGIVSNGTLADSYTQLGYGFDSSTGFAEDSNFDLSGESAFKLTFAANDLPLTLNIYVVNDANLYTFSVVVAGGIVSSTDYVIGFSNFGAADFSAVDALVFEFDTPPSGDFAITSIEAVPEPTTLAGLGIAAVAVLRRRRKA